MTRCSSPPSIPYEAREDGAPQLYDNVKNNISVVEQTVARRRRRGTRIVQDPDQGQDPLAALRPDADGRPRHRGRARRDHAAG